MALYPDYRPLGVKKVWDHSSIDAANAGQVLRRYGAPAHYGDPSEAVGWFDGDNDDLRIMVADYPSGRRITLRCRKSSVRMECVTPERGS